MGSTRLGLTCVAAVLAACTPRGPELLTCPELAVDGWHWVGVVGGPHSVAAHEVELLAGGSTIGRAWSAPDGSFAVRGAVEGVVPQDGIFVRAGGQRFGPFHPGPTEAVLRYRPGSTPVRQLGSESILFTGELDAVPGSTPISSAWMFSWNTGAVRDITPTPVLGTPFTAVLPGRLGECVSVVSRHVSGGSGGCWWPRGGGCICRHCSAEDIRSGACVEPAGGTPSACGCTPGTDPPPSSGRPPLPVDERHDPPPPPDRGETIPVAPESYPPPELDAGPPPDLDAGAAPDLTSGEFAPDGAPADGAATPPV